MTVNLYKGLNQRSGSALGSLADYMQTNRQMKEQSRQFDAAHEIDQRKMALVEEQATNERRDVMWQRQKDKMQADLANFNTMEVEKGRAAALQHGLENGMFENAMWDELANRPEVDASVPPELVQLENGNFGVKVTRKDGGIGFITTDGSSDPNSQVAEFSYDDLYNGYMNKAAEYGFTDVGRAIGKAYQTENNNDMVAEISLEGAGQPQGTSVAPTGGSGGGGSQGTQPTTPVAQTDAVVTPEEVSEPRRPREPSAPETFAGQYKGGSAAGSPNVVQQRSKMLATRINEGTASQEEIDEFKSYLSRYAGIAESDPVIEAAAKGQGMTPLTNVAPESADKESGGGLVDQIGQDLKEKGIVGNVKEAYDQANALVDKTITQPAKATFSGIKKALFGIGDESETTGGAGSEGSNAPQGVQFTALDIPTGPEARDVVNQQGKVAIGQDSNGKPVTVNSRAITDQKFTLRITGDKSRYTNEQKAMMLASALAVGADDPTAVARTVRETMTSIMNKDGTSDAKVNLLRDLVNNQARVEAAKISAKSKLDGKAYEAWQEQYDNNRKRFEETMMSHAKLHFANDDTFDTESLSAMAYTSARNNIGRLVKLGYPPLDTNGDGYADDIDWAKMGSAQMMVLGAMTASAMKKHGQVTDGRWFWKEYGDQHGALDYSKLPKEYGTITQAASEYPQHVEQMMQGMSYPELLNWVAQNGNDFSRAYQGFVSQMQSR